VSDSTVAARHKSAYDESWEYLVLAGPELSVDLLGVDLDDPEELDPVLILSYIFVISL